MADNTSEKHGFVVTVEEWNQRKTVYDHYFHNQHVFKLVVSDIEPTEECFKGKAMFTSAKAGRRWTRKFDTLSQLSQHITTFMGKPDFTFARDEKQVTTFIDILEDKLQQAYPVAAAAEEVEEIISEQAMQRADEILKTDPLQFIVDTIQKIHVGDDKNIKLYFLSGLSPSLTEDQLHIWSVGRSQKGKSHTAHTVLMGDPKQYHEPLSSLSPKALYYKCIKHGSNYYAGKIIYVDEAVETSEGVATLRAATSHTALTPRLVSVDTQAKGGEKSIDIEILGNPVMWISSVDPPKDIQVQKRFLTINPDESQRQDEAVFRMQDQYGRLGKGREDLTKDLEVMEAIKLKILEDTANRPVKILFPIEWFMIDQRHLYPLFQMLIKLITYVNYCKRIYVEGFGYIATKSDFDQAGEIWEGLQKFQIAGVKDSDRDFLEFIPDIKEDADTRSDLAQFSGKSPFSVRDICNRLIDAGLVNADKREHGVWYYWKLPKGKIRKLPQALWDAINEGYVASIEGLDLRELGISPKEMCDYMLSKGEEKPASTEVKIEDTKPMAAVDKGINKFAISHKPTSIVDKVAMHNMDNIVEKAIEDPQSAEKDKREAAAMLQSLQPNVLQLIPTKKGIMYIDLERVIRAKLPKTLANQICVGYLLKWVDYWLQQGIIAEIRPNTYKRVS